MNVNRMVLECLQEMGIIIDEKEIDIRLDEYIQDSLSFIAFIVNLEEKFNIEIPDEYLNEERLMTLSDVENMIENLIYIKN